MANKPKTVPVTVLKRLGGQAPAFDMPVTIKKLDGSEVQFTLHCKAMRKTEWAKAKDERQRELLESIYAGAGMEDESIADDAANGSEAEAAVESPAKKTGLEEALDALQTRGVEANVREGLQDDAKLVMSFAQGWDLENEFSEEGLQDLEDEFGGSIRSILNGYDMAIFQGRLGN